MGKINKNIFLILVIALFILAQPIFYETSINVYNTKSGPSVKGNWTVRFSTEGTSELEVVPVNTEYGSRGDLELIQIKCGDKVMPHKVLDGKMVVDNYNCDEEGMIINKVLTAGKHYLNIVFGGQTVRAENDALPFETGYIETNGWTTVNMRGTFTVPVVVVFPREGAEIDMNHEVATAIVTNVTTESFLVQLRNETKVIAGNVSYIVAYKA